MRKIISIILATVMVFTLSLCLIGCETKGSEADIQNTKDAANVLQSNQPTPSDISYSLERYNLIRRAYWVNGQREKANTLICEVEKPLGYIVLFSGNMVVSSFVVDGKVSSLNSYLTPGNVDSYYGQGGVLTVEMADIDGSYGENDNCIFFFTPDGKYIEWTGTYLYSDIPFVVNDPVVKYEVGE